MAHSIPTAGAGSAPSPAPEGLEARVLFSTFAGTTTIATGDFNGDRFEDEVIFARTRQARRLIAEAGALDTRPRSSLFIVSGADGSLLGEGVPFRVGAGTGGGRGPLVVAGDFNRDGRQDLAVANAGRRSAIDVLLGDGDGTFSRGPRTAAPANIISMAASDVNADGNLDLVLTTAGRTQGNGRRVGAGTGSTMVPDFRSALEAGGGILLPPATSGGVSAEAGAATGATAGGSAGHFAGVDTSTLLGLGDSTRGVVVIDAPSVAGTFSPRPGVSGEAGGSVAPVAASFGDVGIDDGDGGTGRTDGPGQVVILLGNGDGTFRTSTTAGGNNGND